MATVETITAALPGVQERVAPAGAPASTKARSRVSQVQLLLDRQVSWRERLWAFLNGEGGTGSALSFVIHVVLLALLAIPVYQEMRGSSPLSTTVTEAQVDPVVITTAINADELLALPEGDSGGGEQDSNLLTQMAEQNLATFDTLLKDTASTKGDEDTLGDGDGEIAGVRVKEPTNAVRAGSFTTFTLPVARFGEKTEPGQAPKPGQDYYIVVQLAVPKGRTVYPLRDLKGLVIGSDAYRQKIPENAYTMDENGKMTPVAPTKGLKVVEGVVQVFIRVPGAGSDVRDTIQVQSALLKEKQELTLTFQ